MYISEEEIGNRQKHVEEYLKSGLNRAAYCRRHGIQEYQLRRWEKQIDRCRAGDLIPVKVSKSPKPHCIVEIGNGIRLNVCSQEALRMLPKLLKQNF
ncbi:transposase [Candidatus Margulisiibacteriota bacterium]